MKSDIRATTRRRFVAGGVSLLASYASGATGALKIPTTHNNPDNTGNASNASVDYGNATLPRGIRSRRIDTHNQVTLHILEAGFEDPGRPCIVLLHGFPELAYTWRNQLLPLARAGYHVIAPDARGYGLSTAQPVA
jgi:pimeloyl-ACP methyl ester carboxylesterase